MADKRTVLCVDDEEDIIELFTDEFEEAGLNVLKATDGNAAYEIFKNNKIDCIVSDIRMPGGDGVELVKKVKADGSIIPIFLVTGFSDYTSEELMGLGINAVIFKPFDLDEVVTMVSDVIAI